MEMQEYLNLKDETKIDNKNIRKKDIERSDYEQIKPIEGTSKFTDITNMINRIKEVNSDVKEDYKLFNKYLKIDQILIN